MVGLAIFARSVAATATSLILLARAGDELPASLTGIDAVSALVLELTCPIVGLLIVASRPRNLVGWLLLVPSLVGNLQKLALDYGAQALIVDPGSLPFGGAASWFSPWIWLPLLGALPLLLLVYPNGRLLSSRWRPAAVVPLVIGAAAGGVVAIAA